MNRQLDETFVGSLKILLIAMVVMTILALILR